MKRLITSLALLVTTFAQAADLELSVGKTANTREMSYSIGGVSEIAGQRVRYGYASLGSPSAPANLVPNDYADDLLAGWGTPPCHLLRTKEVKELYMTVDPVIYRSGDYQMRLEVGAAVYHPQWQQDICVNAANEPAHAYNNPVNITPIIGLVVGTQATDMSVTMQNITERGDWENHNPPPVMINLSVRHRF